MQSIYFEGKTPCHGFVVANEKQSGKRPVVLVAHAWRGQDEFARDKARQLAALGYLGFAVDIYGEGRSTENNKEAEGLMAPFYLDRILLQRRMCAALDHAFTHPFADPARAGAIGFCFGGLSVIELMRSGAPIKAAVSFHGMLGSAKAKTAAIAKNITGSLLILHGHDDPTVSDADIKSMQEELTKAGVDWQMHIYGHTMHAFTNPMAKEPSLGKLYNPLAEKRSWQAMKNFLNEKFT